MNWGKIDRTRKRAPMHSAETESELFTGRVHGGSGIDDLDEEEIGRLLEALESNLVRGPTQAD